MCGFPAVFFSFSLYLWKVWISIELLFLKPEQPGSVAFFFVLKDNFFNISYIGHRPIFCCFQRVYKGGFRHSETPRKTPPVFFFIKKTAVWLEAFIASYESSTPDFHTNFFVYFLPCPQLEAAAPSSTSLSLSHSACSRRDSQTALLWVVVNLLYMSNIHAFQPSVADFQKNQNES